MKRLFSFLLWSLAFLFVGVGLDQLLVRVELRQPALAEIRTFYVDFRARLLHLAAGLPIADRPARKHQPLPSVLKAPSTATRSAARSPAASGGEQVKPEMTQPAAATPKSAPRYLFTDEKGGLHFADRFEDIPSAYREAAQPLAR